MKNIDRLAKYIKDYGRNGIEVYSIPGTGQWLVAQKIEKNQWNLMLMKPMENITYNLGTVSAENYLALWKELTEKEVHTKATLIARAKEMRAVVAKFSKVKLTKKLIKIENYEFQSHRSS
jgi:hypothetical protein